MQTTNEAWESRLRSICEDVQRTLNVQLNAMVVALGSKCSAAQLAGYLPASAEQLDAWFGERFQDLAPSDDDGQSVEDLLAIAATLFAQALAERIAESVGLEGLGGEDETLDAVVD